VIGAYNDDHMMLTIVLADGKEYCQFESFNATCPADEVILIDEARYGRLQLGRCVFNRHTTLCLKKCRCFVSL